MLPLEKALAEQLFQANLLKVVFATETLAAGINMPARTTVVTTLSKRGDRGVEPLAASALLQMARGVQAGEASTSEATCCSADPRGRARRTRRASSRGPPTPSSPTFASGTAPRSSCGGGGLSPSASR
mmetsp:Transcript_13401/g.42909  ORF Transcript_13401/g.42909 Transcript_13401/m.42909 type:complete len:128 (-) Transcript_13401:291-674(-)